MANSYLLNGVGMEKKKLNTLQLNVIEPAMFGIHVANSDDLSASTDSMIMDINKNRESMNTQMQISVTGVELLCTHPLLQS